MTVRWSQRAVDHLLAIGDYNVGRDDIVVLTVFEGHKRLEDLDPNATP